MAARGTRDDDSGEVPILEAAERAALRRQALGVYRRALALAAAGVAAALVLRFLAGAG